METLKVLRAYIGLGSNLGDRLDHLNQAVREITALSEIVFLKRSSIYETEPVNCDGGWFYNLVLEISPKLASFAFLERTVKIERKLGKNDSDRRKARPIDIDILLWGSQCIDLSALTIPHPRMHERRFVLEPLCELNAEIMHPLLGKSMQDLLRGLPQNEIVRKMSL